MEGDSTLSPVYAPVKPSVYIFSPVPAPRHPDPIKNRTRAREALSQPLYLVPLPSSNYKQIKHLHPCRFSARVENMPLPTSPELPAPDPVQEFAGTGRIYYPVPFATRLAPWGITGRNFCTAILTRTMLHVTIESNTQTIIGLVVFVYLDEENTEGTMDLTEWNKLPPVPPT